MQAHITAIHTRFTFLVVSKHHEYRLHCEDCPEKGTKQGSIINVRPAFPFSSFSLVTQMLVKLSHECLGYLLDSDLTVATPQSLAIACVGAWEEQANDEGVETFGEADP